MLKVDINLLFQLDVLNRNVKRLSRRDNIEEITKKGDKVDNRFLVARRRVNSKGTNRYAIVISKKLQKSAVKRNKLRRQIYETIRLIEKEGAVPSNKSFDIVLFTRRTLLEEDFTGIKKATADILNKIYGR